MTEQIRTRRRRKSRTGFVVSSKMDKTAVVQLSRQFAHPLYGKQIMRTKRVHVHDDLGAKQGDMVRIMETRPRSKRKRWRVVEILTRAE